MVVEAITTVKAGENPKQVEVTLTIHAFVFFCASGHQAQNCPHAQEFAKKLEKRKESYS